MNKMINLENDRSRDLLLSHPEDYEAQFKNFIHAESIIRESVDKIASKMKQTGPIMGYELIAPDHVTIHFSRQMRRRKDYVVRGWITDAAQFANSRKKRQVQIYRSGHYLVIQLNEVVI